MRRRYALAGLVAALSMLSSLVFVASELPIEFGTLSATSTIHWVYAYVSDDPTVLGLEFKGIEFHYRLADGTDTEIPVERIKMEEEEVPGVGTVVRVHFYIKGKYKPKESKDTYVIATFTDGLIDSEFSATGPGFLKRKWR